MASEKNKKIVVLEDDLSMREIVTRKISLAGFTVKSAEDGKQGWELIQAEKPDLILLDLMMPEMDGFQVLEVLRRCPDKKLAETPVIVLSNLWSSEDMLKAKSYSVSGYIVKAYFTPEEILGKIRDVFSGKSIS